MVVFGEFMALDACEKLANSHFWQAVGQAYEHEQWAPSSGAQAVAHAMVEDYAARWTGPRTRRLARELSLALMEDELLDVHGFQRPRASIRRAVGLSFSARKRLPDPPDRSWSDYYRPAAAR